MEAMEADGPAVGPEEGEEEGGAGEWAEKVIPSGRKCASF